MSEFGELVDTAFFNDSVKPVPIDPGCFGNFDISFAECDRLEAEAAAQAQKVADATYTEQSLDFYLKGDELTVTLREYDTDYHSGIRAIMSVTVTDPWWTASSSFTCMFNIDGYSASDSSYFQ